MYYDNCSRNGQREVNGLETRLRSARSASMINIHFMESGGAGPYNFRHTFYAVQKLKL